MVHRRQHRGSRIGNSTDRTEDASYSQRIEDSEWFVQRDDRSVDRKSREEGYALVLAAREDPDGSIQNSVDIEQRTNVVHDLPWPRAEAKRMRNDLPNEKL